MSIATEPARAEVALKTRKKHLPVLDGIRGIAALLVAARHVPSSLQTVVPFPES